MAGNSNPFSVPRIITRAELRRVLMPHIVGYDWAVNALDELWANSTPTPETVRAHLAGIPAVERRILYPSMFAQWWADVQQRKGISTPLDKIIPVR